MSESKVDEFLRSPLVVWVKSLSGNLDDDKDGGGGGGGAGDDEDESHHHLEDSMVDGLNCQKLTDGIFLQRIWDQIDPDGVFHRQILIDKGDTLAAKVKNLSSLIFKIESFYEESLGQLLVLTLPDIVKIARNPADEEVLEDLGVLLLLLLGSAVQCDQKEHFIEKIKSMDLTIQHLIVDCIQQITDNPSSVWLKNDWGQLNLIPAEEQERMYALLVHHIHRLIKERDQLLQKVVNLIVELDRRSRCSDCQLANSLSPVSPSSSANSIPSIVSSQKSQISPSICTSGTSSSPMSMNANVMEQKCHLLVELADVKSKLRRLQQESEEKNELVSELKELIEQNQEASNKLRHENLELIQEARSAKAYRDEIDVLTERVRKVDRLESEVQRYRDKMNELEFYKSRVEEVREDNRILTETKQMLEEQLAVSRKRTDLIPELEAQLFQLQSYSNEISLQRDLERDKIENLIEEVSHLQVEKKAVIEELAQVQSELNHLRCQLNASEVTTNQNGVHTNLLEQLNNDAAKRVLKLELENQKLQSVIENLKNNTTTFINNNRLLEFDSLHNGNDSSRSELEENVSPDSGCVSLVEELNTRLEKMEKENKSLRSISDKLRKAELRIKCLEDDKMKLEEELEDQKAENRKDSYRMEQVERQISQLNTDNHRLHRQAESLQKRLAESQQENQGLESENQKLQVTAVSLRNTVKRLNDLEKEVTHLEGENHRQEQEKKSIEKELVRLKQAIESKDGTIDEQNGKISCLELENKHIKKEIEALLQFSSHLKKLEKEHKEVNQELLLTKKSLTTLRQELVDEKIKSQQLNSELDRVTGALQKVVSKSSVAVPTQTTTNGDWSKLLEDVLENMVKVTLEQNESKIMALDAQLKEACNLNDELKSELQSLRHQLDDGKSQTNSHLLEDLEIKLTQVEDENKNLRNENITVKEKLQQLKFDLKTWKVKVDSLNEENASLQSNQASAQVEYSLLKAENCSLAAEITKLEAQYNLIKESKQSLEMRCEELDDGYKNLLRDHEALQGLHEQLTNDYEALSSTCASLKSSYKSLKMEHKNVQEKLQAWLLSNEELKKMKEAIDSVTCNEDKCNCATSRELMNANKTLVEEVKSLSENHKKLQTEFKMLQNIYKQLRGENNDLKLRHTELQGETAECKDKMTALDIEVSKLSNYCESLAITNNSLEEQRKYLIGSVSCLLSQYQDILNEIAEDTELLAIEKMKDLRAKKETVEKMIKEYDLIAERKKKIAVATPNVVRRMQRSVTDYSLLNKASNQREDDCNLNRKSCPPIDESNEIYGKIWEAETLEPLQAISNKSVTLASSTMLSSSPSNQIPPVGKVINPETKKSGNENCMTRIAAESLLVESKPPPRPPPRSQTASTTATTIENRMTVNLITSPIEGKPSPSSLTAHYMSSGEAMDNQRVFRATSPLCSKNNGSPNFIRGTFRSSSLSFGSPIRKQSKDQLVGHLPLLRNGHHHHHVFYHHHHHLHASHSATPSVNSDSSLTPHEDSEYSDSGGFRREKQTQQHSNSSGKRTTDPEVDTSVVVDPQSVQGPRSPSSAGTNSIWYEYGCV